MASPTKVRKVAKRAGDRNAIELEDELSGLLVASMPEVKVQIKYAERWKRDQVTVVWGGFRGLLPEERFRLVMQAIPEKFYEDRLSKCVWFELTPTESEADLMAMPRSEDIAGRTAEISRSLVKIGFFDELARRLQPDPTKSCPGGLQISREVLRSLALKDAAIADACLLLIRNHSFCDCHALLQGRLAVETEYDSVTAGTKRPTLHKS